MTSVESSTGVAGRTDLEARSKDDNRAMRRGARRRGARNAVSAPSPRGVTGIQICTAKITSEVEGQENKFLASIYGGNLNVESTASLEEADLGAAGDADEVEVWDTTAVLTGKKLKVGDLVHCVHRGFKEETGEGEELVPARQIFEAIGGVGAGITLGRVLTDATGGAKYFGETIVLGDPAIDDTTDFVASEITASAGVEIMFINLAEEGASTHLLTQGSQTPLWIGTRVGHFEDMPVFAGFALKFGACT